MRNVKFIDARSMSHFGVINITRTDDRAINTHIAALTAAGRDMGNFLIKQDLLFVLHLFYIFHPLIGMNFGNLLFIRSSNMNGLEADMRMAKQKFPQLRNLFVIINRKGDPAYAMCMLMILTFQWFKVYMPVFLIYRTNFFGLFTRNCETCWRFGFETDFSMHSVQKCVGKTRT